jgi:hypothetical protein
MKRTLVLSLAAAVAAASFLTLSARAADAPAEGGPPAACPPARKKIDQAFVNAVVGEWAVDYVAHMPDGKKQEGKATSKSVLGIGGTAVIEDYQASGMMGPGADFFGHGVTTVSDDGKTVTTWWFDSMMGDPMKLSGPVTDGTLEMSGAMPGGMGTMKIVSKKVEGGFDWDATIDGKPMLTQKYRRK